MIEEPGEAQPARRATQQKKLGLLGLGGGGGQTDCYLAPGLPYFWNGGPKKEGAIGATGPKLGKAKKRGRRVALLRWGPGPSSSVMCEPPISRAVPILTSPGGEGERDG